MTIEEQWQQFRQAVFKDMAPSATQEREMQKSFFAGAFSMLTRTRALDGEPPSAALAQLYAWDEESREFFQKGLWNYLRKN